MPLLINLEDKMIKECKVVMQNSFSSVVLFDGIKVQIPTSFVNDGVAFVKCEDGFYSVTSKEDYEKFLNSKTKKQSKKTKEFAIDLDNKVVESEAVKDKADEISE